MGSRDLLSGYYDYRLVALSVLIAILAAYTALDLAGRVTTARGTARGMWLCGGAVAMGIGIWAMHYIGMEAFHLPVPVMYDWPTVLASLIAAILASGVALYTVSRKTMSRMSRFMGGVFMGVGIAAMHYTGMEAMRLPAMCMYSPRLVTLSVVLAIAISCIALQMTFDLREHASPWSVRKFGSAVIMGLAIPVMHYVGMAAAGFMPLTTMNASLAHAVSVSSLNIAGIAIVTALVLGMACVTAVVDVRFARQQQALETSQLQLKMVFDNMTEGILVLDQEGKTILQNQAAVRLLQIPDNDPHGYAKIVDLFEVYSMDGSLLAPSQWPTARALRGDFVENFPLIFRMKTTGEMGGREVSSAPMQGGTGQAGQVIITYRDTTERLRSDEARNRLATIVESSDDAIVGRGEVGEILSWNHGAEKLFGFTAAEMVGRSIRVLIPADKQEEEDEILEQVRAGQTVKHFETVRTTKTGELVNVSLTITPIRDGGGAITGASEIARNITQQKQMERQLQQSQKLEAIGQLTDGIAHDFNNLLGVMTGNLDLLERIVGENETAMKRLRPAQKAAARGADLTRRLLAFASNVDLKPTPTELDQSVQNVIEMARALGPQIKILAEIDHSMPLVKVDPSGLESALLNLAVNARDAMPDGGTLTFTTRRDTLKGNYPPVQTGELAAGDYACVSVSDTGCGMSKETLARVFEPFFTTKPRGKGTGLGLSSVYGFVKQSGGTTRIYTEEGFGTTVTIYLPFAEGAALAKPTPAATVTRSGGKVLVVDDEVDLLEVATAYLTDMGYTTLQAENGAGALELIEKHQDIDLVVTDVVMPGGMTGLELAQEVRQRLPHVKLIYSSGFPAYALKDRHLHMADCPMLQKPYERAGFKAVVSAAMEGR
ncbi:MAG TPA: MHYT domain-containing protein [Terracidiphilus sp.]|jgi:PAS domain S-box-containing protein